jgi:hypothetical protein
MSRFLRHLEFRALPWLTGHLTGAPPANIGDPLLQ